MKNQKQIQHLTTQAPPTFPKYDYNFEQYTSTLQTILHDNFGSQISNTLEYDPHEQKYFLQLTEHQPTHRSVQNRPIILELSLTYTLNPQEPLTPQLQHLQNTIHELNQEFNRLRTYTENTKPLITQPNL